MDLTLPPLWAFNLSSAKERVLPTYSFESTKLFSAYTHAMIFPPDFPPLTKDFDVADPPRSCFLYRRNSLVRLTTPASPQILRSKIWYWGNLKNPTHERIFDYRSTLVQRSFWRSFVNANCFSLSQFVFSSGSFAPKAQMEPRTGFEPATWGLQNPCSTNWATSAYFIITPASAFASEDIRSSFASAD